jgi:acetyl esterase
MALDQPTSDLLANLAATGRRPVHQGSPAEARLQHAALTPLLGAGPAMHRVEEYQVGADGARFRIRALVPTAAPRGVLVYLHGGGWVVGGLDGFDTLGRLLADRTGCAVLLVDYRLAPEHPWPAAVDDAWSAVCWADARMTDIAGRRVPLLVAGDSAGGNLAAVTAVRARDAGGPDLGLQVLVYPVTDCDLRTGSYLDPSNQLLLSRESMAWFWDHYVPDPTERARPDASPLRASELTGLPPVEVLTAEHDVLRDEGEAYAERLTQAGVPTGLRRFEGQMHGFFTLVGLLPGSADAIDHVAKVVDHRLTALGF